MHDHTFLRQDQADVILWERLNQYAEELISKGDHLKRIEVVHEEGVRRFTKVSLRLKAYDSGEYKPGLYLYTEQPDEFGITVTHAESRISASTFTAFLNGNADRRANVKDSIKNLFLN